MKLGKLLYFIAIVLMAIISITMLSHDWNLFGYFIALITFAGVLNYVDIEERNSEPMLTSNRKRRAEYFKSLSPAKQKEYLDRIEKELQESRN